MKGQCHHHFLLLQNSKKDMGKDRAADMEMGVTTYSGGWKMKMHVSMIYK